MSLKAGTKPDTHDLAAVEHAIRSLDRADALRLRTAAVTLIRGFRIDPTQHDHEDLLSEAVTRTLAGDRSWRQGVDFTHHLTVTMRSIASDWRRRFVRRIEEGLREVREADPWQPTAKDAGAPRDPSRDIRVDEPNPETALLAGARAEAIKQYFSNDPEVTQVIACLELEMTGQETLEHTGMSRRQWVTATQRMRRKARRLGDAHGP